MKKKILFMGLVLALLVAACMPSQEQINQMVNSAQQTALAQVPTQDVDQIVQATFQALTAQAVTPVPAAGLTGGIAGQVSAGADQIGIFDINSDAIYRLEVEENASSYQINDIPAGVYYAIAFYEMGQFAAPFPQAYSKFVTCGMSGACSDHTPIQVTVVAGQVTQSVDILDNFGNADLNAYMIRFYNFDNTGGTDNIPTFTPASGLSGSIAGKLSYPSSFIPSLAIVAYVVGGSPNDYYYMITNENQGDYQLDNLPPGNYHVVAYVVGGGYAGGYSQMVPCGLTADCADHNLIPVTVTGGQVTSGIDPGDWYAPENAFPAYPLP